MVTPPRRGLGRSMVVVGSLLALLAFDYLAARWLDVAGSQRWPAWRVWVDHGAHWLGDGLHLGLGAAGCWFGGYVLGSRRWQVGGRWMLWGVLLAGFWSQLLKRLIGRPRPRMFVLEGHWLPQGGNFTPSLDSFPSGHAMTIFAVAPLLAWLLPKQRTLIFCLAAGTALGRVLGGDHFPTDMVAGGWMGWLIGQYVAERWREELADEAA